MRPLHIRSEPGSFIDAAFPTPIGLATGYGAWAVSDAAWGAASFALEASGDEYLRGRSAAQAGGGAHCSIFSGASNQFGEYSVFLNMDGPGGQGLAALEGLDGARGSNVSLWGSIPSIEGHESTEPFLYLSREIWRDSPGAGRWRGGFGLKSAVVVWGDKTSPQSGTFCSVRNAVPTIGRNGGYPASGVYYGPVSGTPVWERLEAGEMLTCSEVEREYGDCFESMPSKAMWEGKRALNKGPGGEVFIQTSPGGGGFGDPLLRDPDSVRSDVEEGLVSVEAAGDVYGLVLLEDGSVDRAATRVRIERIRAARVKNTEMLAAVAAG
jgi:N-methylhydantoinase B